MPLQRVRLNDFDKRLVVNPPVDKTEPNALRRARGVASTHTNSILSRWGSTKLYDIANVNSLFKFDGDRFAGTTAGAFYRNGSSIKTGLSGDRLTAITMPPTAGVADQLLVAGGGSLFKVNGSGTVTNWGISADTTLTTANAILTTDCSSLSGWTDEDSGGGVSSQTTFDSKSCFLFSIGDAAGVGAYAQRAADIITYEAKDPNHILLNFDVYLDAMPGTTSHFFVSLYLYGQRIDLRIYNTGAITLNSYATSTTITGLDAWNNVQFLFDLETAKFTSTINSVVQQTNVSFTTIPAFSYRKFSCWTGCRSGTLTPGDTIEAYLNNLYVSTDQFTATAGTQAYTTIEAFENYTSWTNAGFTSLANETTIKKLGTNALKLVLAPGTVASISKSLTLDMTAYTSGSTRVSANQDLVSFWIYTTNVSALDYLQVSFSLSDTSFTNAYTFKTQRNYSSSAAKLKGVVDGLTNEQDVFLLSQDGVLEIITEDELPAENSQWRHIQIPKRSFRHTGDRTYTWYDVKALKITARASKESSVTFYLDDLSTKGGAGLQGTYQYAITFKNSSTGHRSNQVGSVISVEDVKRTPITLINLPQPSDSQADVIEIWRTLGNGSLFFYCDEVAVGTTSYSDEVADCFALDSREGSSYLTAEELPLDNYVPESTFSWVAGPYNASAFWLSSASGKKGRIYYSPIGRPEAVEGYLTVTSDEEALQGLWVFNGALYAASRSRWFQVSGTNPYVVREVYKVPGTTAPFTAAPTPYGIVYQADDGIRLFNGTSSELGSSSTMLRLFQGEALENLSAFEGVVGVYARSEYVVASSTNTLAANGETGTWRDLGLTLNALLYEPDTAKLVCATSAKVLTLEDEGVYADDGTAITFAVDTSAIRHPDDYCWLVDGIEIDANTGNNTLAVSALVDGTAVSLGNLQTTTRSGARWSVGYLCHYVQARLTGSLSTARSEIYGISFDLQPLELIIRVAGGTQLSIPGRLSYARDYVSFRIDDWSQLHPTKRQLDWQWLYVEADPNSISCVPSLIFADTTVTLSAPSGSTRDYFTYPVNHVGRLKEVRMTGTFSSAIELRRLELDVRP